MRIAIPELQYVERMALNLLIGHLAQSAARLEMELSWQLEAERERRRGGEGVGPADLELEGVSNEELGDLCFDIAACGRVFSRRGLSGGEQFCFALGVALNHEIRGRAAAAQRQVVN